MAVVGLLFFDTSVLLPALLALEKDESSSERLFDALVAGRLDKPVTAWHCCLEFFAVSTRLPTSARLEPQDALRLLQEEILPRFEIAQLPAEQLSQILRTTLAERIVGGRIYDLHIAEIARSSGADTVVTNNRRHFVSLLRHGIRVLTAAELIEELGL